MSKKSDLPNDSVFIYNLEEQQAWLDNLSNHKLKAWLRDLIWLKQAFPMAFNNSSAIGEVSHLLQNGSFGLKTKVRKILPELLREWGRGDTYEQLEDLLVLCSRVRCVEAETPAIQILNERLTHLEIEEIIINARQNLLSVLSGFGCTEHTVYLFEKYIEDINFSAICYNALYRYQRIYASSYLSLLATLYAKNQRLDEFQDLLEYLFQHNLENETAISKFWVKTLLENHEPKQLPPLLNHLSTVGIIFAPYRSYPGELTSNSQVNLYVDYDQAKDWNFKGHKIEIDASTEEGRKVVLIINRWQEEHIQKEKARTVGEFR